jgi:phage-related protein
MAEKPLRFLGSALEDLRAFPDEARRVAGHQLHLVQHGLEPSDWKPMGTVGPGVAELRIHSDGANRVFYVAKFAEAIYVLDAFAKRTQQTRNADVDLGRHRYHELVHARQLQAARKRRK